MRDPLFVTTGKLFRLTLPLEVVVQKLSMAVGLPVQGLRVGVDPIHEGIPHLLLERPPFSLQLVVLLTLRIRRVLVTKTKREPSLLVQPRAALTSTTRRQNASSP